MRIIALTTCHNRREFTLRSLQSLTKQYLPKDYYLEICVVDDGSSDGTGDAIREKFPEVKIIEGTGNLYWAGGMLFGWNRYVKKRNFDFLFVFNDDIELNENALKKLISTSEIISEKGNLSHVVVGALKDHQTNKLSYGGLIQDNSFRPLRFKKVIPRNFIQECDTLNMNAALIRNDAIKLNGFLAKEFVHTLADYDFGLRLKKKGGSILLASGFIGTCKNNSLKGTSLEPNLSVKKRLKRFTGMKEQPPLVRAVFFKRHAGLFWPIFWLLPYFKIFLMSLVKFRISVKRKE